MWRKKYHLNNRGIGLIEAAISAGLLGFLAIIVSNLSMLTTRSDAFARQRVDAASTMTRISSLLISPETCKKNFEGLLVPAVTPPNPNSTTGPVAQIKERNDAVVYDKNSTTPYGSIFIHNILLHPIIKSDPLQPTGVIPLLIVFKGSSSSMGSTYFALSTDLIAEVDGANRITKCRSIKSSENAWEGDGDSLLFLGGNVNIGNPSIIARPDPAEQVPDLPLTNPDTAVPERDPSLGPDPLASFLNALPVAPALDGSAGAGFPDPNKILASSPPYAWSLRVENLTQAEAFYYRSDEVLKADVQFIDGLNIISRLRGVRYRWRKDNQVGVGLIAQEVAQVLPEAVNSNPSSKQLSVNYEVLVAPLIEAIKSLHAKSIQQKKELKRLEILISRERGPQK